MMIFKSSALKFIDNINKKLEPWEPFTRAVNPVDDKLYVLKTYFEMELDQDFCGTNKELLYDTVPTSLGDSCIWQGVYTAMRVLAYKADPTAREAAMRNAMMGLSYYVVDDILVRGVSDNMYEIPAGKIQLDPTKNYVERYKRLYRDDASLDSLLGYLFGCAVAMKFAPVAFERSLLRVSLGNLAQQFLANGFRLKNFDGSYTTYGDCRPGYLQGPIRNLTAALLLKMGHLSNYFDNTAWQDICKRYSKDFEVTETHFLWKHAWHNDHLAMLANLSYVMTGDQYQPGWNESVEGLIRILNKHRDCGNSFLVFMCELLRLGAVTSQEKDRALWVLKEFKPSDEIPNGKAGSIQMSTKMHLVPEVKMKKWGKDLVATQPLPMWMRPPKDYAWQRNPYTLDGSTDTKLNGLDFLIAYWAYKADILNYDSH